MLSAGLVSVRILGRDFPGMQYRFSTQPMRPVLMGKEVGRFTCKTGSPVRILSAFAITASGGSESKEGTSRLMSCVGKQRVRATLWLFRVEHMRREKRLGEEAE